MREILFRGKRKDNGEWVYGNVLTSSIGVVFIKPRNKGIFSGCFIEVIPETIGQYTGLKDKNKERIWEGDLISCDELIYEIFWDQYNCCWSAETNNKDKANTLKTDGEFQLCENECDLYEVIGNIHDNPELLAEASNG